MKQAAMAAAAEYTWSNAALQYEAIFKEIGVKDVLNGTSVRWSNKAVKTVIFQQVLVGWGVALINGPHLELHTASFFFFEIVRGKYLHFRYKSLRCYYVASEFVNLHPFFTFFSYAPRHMLQWSNQWTKSDNFPGHRFNVVFFLSLLGKIWSNFIQFH